MFILKVPSNCRPDLLVTITGGSNLGQQAPAACLGLGQLVLPDSPRTTPLWVLSFAAPPRAVSTYSQQLAVLRVWFLEGKNFSSVPLSFSAQHAALHR